MINSEWLCSSFKLCDIVDVSQSIHTDNSMQVEINRNSFPQPAYNPSTVKVTLEAYSLLLDAAFEQNMKHTDQKVIEHQYAQTDSIHHFAQKTAKTIIESAMTKRETPSSEHGVDYHSDNKCNLIDPRQPSEMRGNDVDMLAEELTLQACCKALEEMGRHCVLRPDDTSDKDEKEVMEGASGHNCDEDMDIKMEEYDYKFATTLKSMVSLGSIEYPDAPPSTPLHPEMLKSRDSFTRKLKGGLAKEFLPSPPPSTPKDQMQPLLENQITGGPGDKSEFMIRLMRSLSLECRWQGGLEEEKSGEVNDGEIPKLADYAAQLSTDILNFITTNDVEVNKEVWATAEELADEIVIASLAEVITREKEASRREQKGHTSILLDIAPSTACSAAEDIKILASDLIINAVVHAFAKLKQGGFQDGSHLSSQATEQQPWEKEIHLCEHSTPSNKASTISCCNDTLKFNGIAFDAMNMTSSVHTYANKFAQDVLQNSVHDASCLLVNRQGTHVKIGSEKDIIPLVIIKMYSEVSKDVQELQCALLWAAASQTGTSELLFDLPVISLTQQLCRLSRSARLNGWTVGALVASLCQFCDMQQEASRGHHMSSDSLFGHLQQLIDNTPLN